MRSLAILLILGADPALADIARQGVACDAVTAAPGCLGATALFGFDPTGGMVVLGDRLRLAGIDRRDGADRMVILDLSLPDGEVLAVVPLVGDVPLGSTSEFAPDGSVLLVAPHLDWSKITEDALLPQTMLAFDAWGKPIGRAEGLGVTALVDAFGENRLRFEAGRVTLALPDLGDKAQVVVDLAKGLVVDGPVVDGAWLYQYVFDRDRGWHQGDVVAEARYSRDGSPSAVLLRGAEALVLGGVPGVYDREFSQPVLSPDGGSLAVLQLAEGAPGPILLALRLPEGGEVWRGVVAEAKDRPVLYRWSAGGDLVTLQPHPVLTGTETLIVYRPGP